MPDTNRAQSRCADDGAPMPGEALPLVVDFSRDRPAGAVVGRDGAGGVDVENVLAVDHGALRLRSLARPGWGRAAVAWGPVPNRCGTVAVLEVLNGHHASENVDAWPALHQWVAQWVRGTQVDPPWRRLWRARRYDGRDPLRRRLRAWFGHRAARRHGFVTEENLAVGFFDRPVPAAALGGGAGFVIRSTGPENGALSCAGGDRRTDVVTELQNLPLALVVILREQGALLAAASLDGARGLPASPTLRPLHLDPTPLPPELWVGLHQSVLGQVGWGVDTRVSSVVVDRPAGLARWSTTAQAADRLDGHAGTPLRGVAEVGGEWRGGGFVHADDGGAVACGPGPALTTLRPGAPSGLVHLRVTDLRAGAVAGLVVRHRGPHHGWFVTVDEERTELRSCTRSGEAVAVEGVTPPAPGPVRSISVLDDGSHLTVVVDGTITVGPVPAPSADAADEVDAAGAAPDPCSDAVGLWCPPGRRGATLRDFEAHPARIELPAAAPAAVEVPVGVRTVFDERFGGEADDLAGRLAPHGQLWSHTFGSEPFRLDGSGAVATVAPAGPAGPHRKARAVVRANGHRNAYTVPWPDPHLADLAVTIVPPGTARHQGHGGRGGLVFAEDDDNQLIVNTWLDDNYDGTSVSSFVRRRGFEEVFDAVWVNVGRRITWGRPYELRVAFDGDRYLVRVDGEPVLYRRLTDIVPAARPLHLTRVGICTNWEFGDDTGSRFVRLIASGGGARPRTTSDGGGTLATTTAIAALSGRQR